MLWQYRTILFEFAKGGLLSDKYVDDEEMEKTFNQMGSQGWDLINVILLQDGVLAFLKKPKGESPEIEEVEPEIPAPQTVVASPSVKARPAVHRQPTVNQPPVYTHPTFSTLEQEVEPEDDPLLPPERPKRSAAQEDSDFIGGIRIS